MTNDDTKAMQAAAAKSVAACAQNNGPALRFEYMSGFYAGWKARAAEVERDASDAPPASDPAATVIATDPEARERLQQTIRDGNAVMMGTPPTLTGKPDFTVTRATLPGGFTLRWQTVSAGFGEIDFEPTGEDGPTGVRIYRETMGRDFIKAALAKMVDDAELDD